MAIEGVQVQRKYSGFLGNNRSIHDQKEVLTTAAFCRGGIAERLRVAFFSNNSLLYEGRVPAINTS
jgi:hypothetical protein